MQKFSKLNFFSCFNFDMIITIFYQIYTKQGSKATMAHYEGVGAIG